MYGHVPLILIYTPIPSPPTAYANVPPTVTPTPSTAPVNLLVSLSISLPTIPQTVASQLATPFPTTTLIPGPIVVYFIVQIISLLTTVLNHVYRYVHHNGNYLVRNIIILVWFYVLRGNLVMLMMIGCVIRDVLWDGLRIIILVGVWNIVGKLDRDGFRILVAVVEYVSRCVLEKAMPICLTRPANTNQVLTLPVQTTTTQTASRVIA